MELTSLGDKILPQARWLQWILRSLCAPFHIYICFLFLSMFARAEIKVKAKEGLCL